MTRLYLSIPVLFLFFSCSENLDIKREEGPGIALLVTDPLASWKESEVKRDIVKYVKSVTDSSDTMFVPVADRIATFDNDGTLWAEKPLVQELFATFRVARMLRKDPSLANKQPFKAVMEQDRNYFNKGGEKALFDLVAATHTGMSEDEFEEVTHDFFNSGNYPALKLHLDEIAYQPQRELLDYLRANGFNVFICTGGTIEFVRAVSEDFYGVPKDQVIGTSFQYVYLDSNRSLLRNAAIGSFNDKAMKPSNIQLHIGRRPIFTCGNEGGGGDIAMLSYSQGSKYPSFQLLVNHNDSVREFYYQEKDSASLKAAALNKWHVISMKDDWKEIFGKRR